MTKINGQVLEQSIEVADSEKALGTTQSLKRLMDAGERYFWAKKGRGGVKSSWTMKAEVYAGATEGYHAKRKGKSED